MSSDGSASFSFDGESVVNTGGLSPGEDGWKDFLSRLGLLAIAPELSAAGLVRLDTVIANEATLLDDKNLRFLKPLQRRKIRTALAEVSLSKPPPPPNKMSPKVNDDLSAGAATPPQERSRGSVGNAEVESNDSISSIGTSDDDQEAVLIGITQTSTALPVCRGYSFVDRSIPETPKDGGSASNTQGNNHAIDRVPLLADTDAGLTPPSPPPSSAEIQPLPVCRGYRFGSETERGAEPEQPLSL